MAFEMLFVPFLLIHLHIKIVLFLKKRREIKETNGDLEMTRHDGYVIVYSGPK